MGKIILTIVKILLKSIVKMVRNFDAILAFQKASTGLKTGTEIWYEVFIWCLFSSLFIYFLAAAAAFLTLRKHKFGGFYSLMILLMGVILPLTLGVLSSACIAFVYKTSSFSMDTSHAMMWGVGQTVIHAFFWIISIISHIVNS